MFRIYILIILIFLFSGCTYKNTKIADLETYSQNPEEYTANINQTIPNQEFLSKEYLKRFFIPWNQEKLSISKKDAQWGNSYKNRKIYLENHNLASKEWFEEVISNTNFDDYNQILQKAIIVKNTNVRVLPTNSKLFYNPNVAGEGFPFDYNQNSSIKINTPILISHYSKDKAWAYVQSHFVSGWIRMDNIAFVDNDFINRFQSNSFVVSIKEHFPLLENNLFLEYIKVGTFFPTIENKIYVSKKNLEGKAVLKEVDIDETYVSSFPITFNKTNLTSLSNQFLGELYGWGGLLEHRDCSSFTQDFFAPFGLYLNRNSKAQRSGYKYIDIYNLSDEKKKKYIIENGIPFLTLIYLRGHIMLYIGQKDGNPLVMHNMWGVRTWKNPFQEGRNVVGKTVITSLEPGIELENANFSQTILKKVHGLVFLNEKNK